ncbi:hypothetical protein BJX96DRAFT_161171 [Aspergillus floccosus]
MLPDIKEFVAKFKTGYSQLEFYIGKREAHVAPIYNLYVRDKRETGQGKKLIEWLQGAL